jgi:hypothetical protein
MLAFVIYTHSSYFDIFKIQLDQIKKLFKDLEYDIYVLSDILYTTESGGYSSKKNKRYNKNKRRAGLTSAREASLCRFSFDVVCDM